MYVEARGKHWISLSISFNQPLPLKVFYYYYFYVHSLLLQRTAVQFPAHTVQKTCNSSSTEPDTIFEIRPPIAHCVNHKQAHELLGTPVSAPHLDTGAVGV